MAGTPPPSVPRPSVPPDSRTGEPLRTDAGDLETQARLNDFRRQEEVRDALQWGKVCVARISPILALAIVAGVLAVVVWHYLSPESRQWLTDSQLRNIERLALYSSISFLVAQFLRRAL